LPAVGSHACFQGVARPIDLALFYRTLAELLGAGVPVTGALAHAGSLLRGAGGLDVQIERGATLTQALDTAPAVFPAVHRRLIAAGEASGRIEPVLKRLAAHCEKTAAMRRKVLGGLALPAAVFHFVALIAPIPAWFSGSSFERYLMSSFGLMAAVWLAIAAGALLLRAVSPAWRDTLWRTLPWFDRMWSELNWWWLLSGMEMLTAAGVGGAASLRICAGASRSPRLATVLRQAADTAESRGESVSIALEASGEFPVAMMAQWKTGERSGYLDEVFARLARDYAACVEARFEALAEWVPRAVYFAVSLYVAWQIMRIWGARPVVD